jgi:hypothetical protein
MTSDIEGKEFRKLWVVLSVLNRYQAQASDKEQYEQARVPEPKLGHRSIVPPSVAL